MIRRILIAYAFIIIVHTACADIVLLQNGNRLEGEVVAQDGKSVTVRIGNSELSVPREDVKQIIMQDTPRDLYRAMLEGLDEDDPKGHYQVALYCAKEGLEGEAVELLRRAVDLQPNYPEAMKKLREILAPAATKLFQRAGELAAEGKPSKALESYALLARKYPESPLAPEAEAAVAELYFANLNYPAAMKQWKDILEKDRQNTRALMGAVQICERIGKLDKAIEILDGVLHYETDQQIREQCRGKRDAITEIIKAKQAIEKAPDAPENYALVARQFEKLGQMRIAAKWMEDAVEKGARDLQIVEKLARLCDKDHRVAKALKYWTYLKTLGPDAKLSRVADARIEQLAVLKLIPEYLQSDSVGRREKILAQLDAADVELAQAISVVRRWLEFPRPEETGMLTRNMQLANGLPASYVLFVPQNYDPELRWPMIVALHGAGGTGDRYIYTWAKHAQEHGYLVLAPTSGRRGWGAARGERIVLSAIADVRESFNIDTNRLFIDGTSAGAQAAWMYALRSPGMFAGLVSRSGAVDQLTTLLLPNAQNTPVYIVHGLKDRIIPVDNIKKVRRALMRLGCDLEFRLDTKSGHSTFSDQTPRIIEWMAGRARDPYPQDVRFIFRSLKHPRAYWLQAELLTDNVFDPSRPIVVPKVGGEPLTGELRDNYLLSMAKAGMAVLNGKIAGNSIEVTAKHIIGYTILLSDELLDLDDPVEVHTNRKKSFYGKVRRSLPFMLEWARRNRDPEMLFSANLRIVIRKERP